MSDGSFKPEVGARVERLEAERLCALIAEAEDREIVEAELAREPWFGTSYRNRA